MNHGAVQILLTISLWLVVTQFTTVTSAGGNKTEHHRNITSFDSFLDAYNKKYRAQYRIDRRKTSFEKNMEAIERHNKDFNEGKATFVMGVNELADMNHERYLKTMVRMKEPGHRKMDVKFTDEIVGAGRDQRGGMPDSWDWRQKGFQTGLVNQKTCGSCYAFSIAYAINAQIHKRIGRMEFVSQQQMVDCSVANGNQGCAGGSLRFTLQYLEKSGGCMRESDYPYTSSVSSEGECLYYMYRLNRCRNCHNETSC